jgi:hypothetical protein
MDISKISTALQLALSANLQDRKKAYEYIELYKHHPNFTNILLSITLEVSVD